MPKDINKQFQEISEAFFDSMPDYILAEMNKFGSYVVNSVVLPQKGYKNLTGQTQDSYSYAVYYEGKIVYINGISTSKTPIRGKFTKGETVTNFYDVDGAWRRSFTGVVETDSGSGRESALNFLKSYKPKKRYEIVFTTGTEYSSYLENAKGMNVLLDAKMWSIPSFLKSFKPIE